VAERSSAGVAAVEEVKELETVVGGVIARRIPRSSTVAGVLPGWDREDPYASVSYVRVGLPASRSP
jgi:hypothetical protein